MNTESPHVNPAAAPMPPSQPLRANAPPSRLELSVLGLIVALAAALRFHALEAKGFWFDEGISVGIARLDWYDFARILWRREGNMSLYYLLLRGWMHFGSGEAFIRSLSVVFALATVPAIYLLGRRLFGPQTGLIAAALLAVNGFHLQVSQEARSYTLFVFLCTLSSLYFVKALQGLSSRGHVLTSALAVYAHFFAALLLAVQWFSLRLLDDKRMPPHKPIQWRRVALLSLPVVAFIAATGAGPLNWLRRPGLKEIWELIDGLAGNGGAWPVAAYSAACLVAIIPGWRKAILRQVPWAVWRYRFLLLWLLFPPAFILLVSLARPLFLPRYFLFCLPALLLLAASGLARLRSAWTAAPAVLLFLALSFSGVAFYFRQRPQYDDWRDISHILLSQSHPGDALVFDIAMARIPYEYYHSIWPAYSAPKVIYPAHAGHITFLDFVAKPDYAELAAALPQYQRVWLVLSHTGTPPTAEPGAASLMKLLHASFPAVQEHPLGNCLVFLFSKGDVEN